MTQLFALLIFINGIGFSFFLLHKKYISSNQFMILIPLIIFVACVVLFHETIHQIKLANTFELSTIKEKVEKIEKENSAIISLVKDFQNAENTEEKTKALAEFRNLINSPLSVRKIDKDTAVQFSDKNSKIEISSILNKKMEGMSK